MRGSPVALPLRQQPAHVALDRRGRVLELQVGDGHAAPAGGLQDAALLAVPLEGGPGLMGLPAVDLDDDPLPPPDAVDLEASTTTLVSGLGNPPLSAKRMRSSSRSLARNQGVRATCVTLTAYIAGNVTQVGHAARMAPRVRRVGCAVLRLRCGFVPRSASGR